LSIRRFEGHSHDTKPESVLRDEFEDLFY
jgi:hypothetical protein